MSLFQLVSDFELQGDQPEALACLAAGVAAGERAQVLLGVTGSGKTFTIAHTIARAERPALVLAPNKTLAAQLYKEFRDLFPHNAVEYFVSYYDYYQPEAYVPRSDTYIEKDSSINETIDRMRHAATRGLLERRDVIIVASVSCIYGLGSPAEYQSFLVPLEANAELSRDEVLSRLVDNQYVRNDIDFHRGTFRVRGDVVEIFPAYEDDRAIRVEFFGDFVEAISEVDPLRGVVRRKIEKTHIFPNSHYVTGAAALNRAVTTIRQELAEQLKRLRGEQKLLEAQRLEQRTNFDLEMLRETGMCSGIENYSRHLDGRAPGVRPFTLLDYFPEDFLLIVDESHVAVPQLNGMYNGDRSRKETLVQYGFRLPSALDNRPLRFEEFMELVPQIIYVSATPGDYELEQAAGHVAEQLIRPTGLCDPQLEVRPATNQVDDLLEAIRERVERGERVLVTTLTKRMAEDLTDYYAELDVRVRYLHSDVKTLERFEIIRELRRGKFDVLVGVNLLREGLDLPEVSLVAILDADKEGFLRSKRSLIQTIGRAARHLNGTVLLYADVMTRSLQEAISETDRRRATQAAFNAAHDITPTTVISRIEALQESVYEMDYVEAPMAAEAAAIYAANAEAEGEGVDVEALKREMREAARQLEFERAADLRDRIARLEQTVVLDGLR